MKKIFKDVYRFSDESCDLLHEDVDSFEGIDDKKVTKAHAVCVCDGKLLWVYHARWDVWSIPGGSREPGEKVEDLLRREVREEANCEILSFQPLSVQKVNSASGAQQSHLQYLCAVRSLGAFEKDPAGSISRIAWAGLHDYKRYIEPLPFREAVMLRALEVLEGHK